MNSDVVAIRTAIAFSRSALRSGEPYTKQAEDVLDELSRLVDEILGLRESLGLSGWERCSDGGYVRTTEGTS
jgi:hypothetical protein